VIVPYTHDPTALAPGLDWHDQSGRSNAALAYPAYNVRQRLDSLAVYNAMFPGRLALVQDAFSIRWTAAARRYAVTHVVLDPPTTPLARSVYAIATGGGTRVDDGAGPNEVWAVPHRPWAGFARDVERVDGPQEAVRALASGTEALVVEAPADLPTAPGRVLAIERGLESVRIVAEADGEATLFVADAWWPGWEATIDGMRTALHPADVLARAVRFPAGRHAVVMRYRPPEAGWGLRCSGAGVAALVAGVLALRRRGARRLAGQSGETRQAMVRPSLTP
jgi:hypothetical protein